MPFSSRPIAPMTITASGWCIASWWPMWMSVWTASTSSEKHRAARKMHTINMVKMSIRVQPNVLRSERSWWWTTSVGGESEISVKLPLGTLFLIARGGHGCEDGSERALCWKEEATDWSDTEVVCCELHLISGAHLYGYDASSQRDNVAQHVVGGHQQRQRMRYMAQE